MGMWVNMAVMENSMEAPQKTKTEQPPYDPVVSKGSGVSLQRDSCTETHSVAMRAMRQEQGAYQQMREM